MEGGGQSIFEARRRGGQARFEVGNSKKSRGATTSVVCTTNNTDVNKRVPIKHRAIHPIANWATIFIFKSMKHNAGARAQVKNDKKRYH